MEEAHRLHKDAPFGWLKMLREFMAAQAQAREERALILWSESRDPRQPPVRPDDTYRLIRGAFGPRF